MEVKASGQSERALGSLSLAGLMVGSILGAGIFDLPRQFARSTGPLGLLVAWGLTLAGVLSLATLFQSFCQGRPAAWSTIQKSVAQAVGPSMSSLSAWGYWCSAWIGNVAYLRLILGTLAALSPGLGLDCPWRGAFLASLLLWGIHALALRGVRNLARWNLVLTTAKLLLLSAALGCCLRHFCVQTFQNNWEIGLKGGYGFAEVEVGPLLQQVNRSLLITAWLFVGFEGSVLLSHHTKHAKVVQRATTLGLALVSLIYLALSLGIYGCLPAETVAGYPEGSSLASLLDDLVGSGAGTLARVGIIGFAAGSLVPWVLYAGEVAEETSRSGLFPISLREGVVARLVPSERAGLWISTALTQLLVTMSYVWAVDYDGLALVATFAMVPSYILAAYVYLQAAWGRRRITRKLGPLICGSLALIYSAWLFYSAEPSLLPKLLILFGLGWFLQIFR